MVLSTESCFSCHRVLINTHKCVLCSVCGSWYHFSCADLTSSPECNWFCKTCTTAIFPFNHFEDEFEFKNALSTPCCKLDNVMEFNPIDYFDEGRALLLNPDIDADINFFNSIHLCSSKYLSLEQVTSAMTSLQYNNCFSVAHINCRSLFHKLSDIHLFLVQSKANVLAVTETWLTSDTEGAVEIPGFNFVHNCRNGAKGGGVGFFIKKDVAFEQVEATWTNALNNTFECMFIKLYQTNGKDIMIGAVYRPPGSHLDEFNEDMDHMLSNLSSKNRKIILAGDFNVDLMKVDHHYPTSVFFNTLMSHQLLPTILRPTRITASTATLIDNIFTNILSDSQDSSVVMCDISDHLPILFHTDLRPSKPSKQFTLPNRLVNEKTITSFRESLTNCDWSDVMYYCSNNDPSSAYKAFLYNYTMLYEKAFPIIENNNKKSQKIKQPWMTSGLLKSCNKKSRLYLKYLKFPNEMNKMTFIRYRNKFKQLRKEAEKMYYAEKFLKCEYSLTKTWKIIKAMLSSGNSLTVDSFIIDGVETKDKEKISDKFNEYFINIGPTLASNISESPQKFDHFLKMSSSSSIGIIESSAQEIIEISKQLNYSSSSGVDGINPQIGKVAIEAVAYVLADIINCSFLNGIVPDELKIAKVVPLYKNGEKNKISNYRPISVLPYFSKFFEKIMYKRIIDYFSKEKTLSPEQFGFRKQHSTFMALLEMQVKISESMDKNEFALGIFFDLSKAFDTVNHKILLKKLEHCGIRGLAHQWLSHYLRDRTQCVYFDGHQSSYRTIRCGVPQGSILGPLLFLVYINDLPLIANQSKFILFADDSNVFFSDKSAVSLEKRVNSELEMISVWFKANKLSLNIDKTKFILFRSHRKPAPPYALKIVIDNNELLQESSSKFLGVYVDQHLTWNDHILHISKKLSKNISILSRIRHCLPKHILQHLYYTLFFPYLSYCNISWGSNYPSRLRRLVILQKRAIRITCSLRRLDSTKLAFKENNLLKLADITKFQTGLFMYRYHNKLLPSLFDNYFIQGVNVHKHYTRTSCNYRAERARTNVKQFSIKCSGPQLWNSLPSTITTELSVNRFKIVLKKYLLNSHVI